MSQPRSMKLNIINLDENYLSSELFSIALTWFWNRLDSSWKYRVQLFLIAPHQNLLQALKNWSSSATGIRSGFFTVGNK
jgi:hypothetical protein